MELVFPKEKPIHETEEFKEFSKDIDFLIEFLECFSELNTFNGHDILFFIINKTYTLNTSLIKSSAQTLKSIKLCCSIGSFSDANTLIRKLRDDLIQYVYILSVIKSRNPFTEESIKKANFDSAENFIESFQNLQFNSILADDEQAIAAWFTNSVSDLKSSIRRKLEFENYMKVQPKEMGLIGL